MLDDDEITAQLGEWEKEAEDVQNEWRKEAKENVAMYNGYQWPSDDLQKLMNERRPAVTFNRVGPVIDAISGLEVQQRRQIKYYPRKNTDGPTNDIMNAVSEWVRQDSNQDFEESDSFRDMLNTGIGCLSWRMDYTDSELGRLIIERVDPIDMAWDPRARKRNLNDRRWDRRKKVMSKREAKEMFPEHADYFDSMDDSSDPDHVPRQNNDLHPYSDKPDSITSSKLRRGVIINEYQYWILEDAYRVDNPFMMLTPDVVQAILPMLSEEFGDKIMSRQFVIDKDQYTKLTDVVANLNVTLGAGLDLVAAKMKRKKFYRVVKCGPRVLEHEENAVNAFTHRFITAKRDQKDNNWYGIMRAMKDPQLWANKLFSNILHIFTTNSKGGLLFETGAFSDPDEAREEWARPDGMVELNDGGLAKIQEKSMVNLPPAAADIMSYAINAIRDSSGVSVEMLGLADKNRAGVLEQQRIQQSQTVITDFFDAMAEYRRDAGKVLFEFTKEYLADEPRLIKLKGENGPKYVNLFKDQLADDYDIIIEEAPISISMRHEVFSSLVQLVNGLAPELRMSLMPLLLEYSSFPADVKEQMMQMMQQQMQPSPEQQQAQQLQLRKVMSEIDKDAANAESARASAQEKIARIPEAQARAQRESAEAEKANVEAIIKAGEPLRESAQENAAA